MPGRGHGAGARATPERLRSDSQRLSEKSPGDGSVEGAIPYEIAARGAGRVARDPRATGCMKWGGRGSTFRVPGFGDRSRLRDGSSPRNPEPGTRNRLLSPQVLESPSPGRLLQTNRRTFRGGKLVHGVEGARGSGFRSRVSGFRGRRRRRSGGLPGTRNLQPGTTFSP